MTGQVGSILKLPQDLSIKDFQVEVDLGISSGFTVWGVGLSI